MTIPNEPPSPTPPPGMPGPISPQDAKNMAALGHFLNFTLLGPLIIYLMKKGSDAFLDVQVKESLNFALICFIVHVILTPLVIIPFAVCIIMPLHVIIFLVQVAFGIMGGMKARDGIAYRYPFNFALIK